MINYLSARHFQFVLTTPTCTILIDTIVIRHPSAFDQTHSHVQKGLQSRYIPYIGPPKQGSKIDLHLLWKKIVRKKNSLQPWDYAIHSSALLSSREYFVL